MFERLASFVSRHAVATLLAWIAVAGVLRALAPPFVDVAVQDQTAFLGKDAPSVWAGERLRALWPREEFDRGGAIVLSRPGGLTEPDRGYLRRLERWLRGPGGPENVDLTFSAASRPSFREFLDARDGESTILIVGFTTAPFEPDTNEAVAEIRRHLAATGPEGLRAHVTGNAGVAADQSAAIEEAVHRTTIITLVLVVLILIGIYRSPIAPVVPLLTIGVAFVASKSLVAVLASAGLQVSSLVETFMVVIVFGAGTDYCLFIVSRFREDLGGASDPGRPTLVATMAVVGAVIASSAATVIVGFGSQSIARFGMFRTTGPAMAVAVAVTLAAGLTLTPALLALLGRRAFWPYRFGLPRREPAPSTAVP